MCNRVQEDKYVCLVKYLQDGNGNVDPEVHVWKV